MWPKSCPKCRGDLFRESQVGNVLEVVCLQCGRMLSGAEAVRLLRPSLVPERRSPREVTW